MHLTNANKALIITLLLAAIIVLTAYNFSVLKQNERLAETYFELIPKDEIEEEPEQLDDILESLDDVLATNRAFNSTRNYEDFEDEEFKSTMDKIKNRDARTVETESQNSDTNAAKRDPEESESFNSINDIIAKRSKAKEEASSANGANKNSTISYSLVDRDAMYLPPPIYLCERGGKIVVNITVDAKGNVTDASFNGASTSTNGCLIDHALEYAKASKFNASNKSQQIGTITFLFQGK